MGHWWAGLVVAVVLLAGCSAGVIPALPLGVVVERSIEAQNAAGEWRPLGRGNVTTTDEGTDDPDGAEEDEP